MSDNDVYHKFKNAFIIALLIIMYSLIAFIFTYDMSIKKFISNGKLFGLGESFWGALIGAFLAGLSAVLVFFLENFSKKKEKSQEEKKVIYIMRNFIDEILKELKNIERLNEKISKIYDPYSEVEVDEDEYGNQHVLNFPPQEFIDDYDRATSPINEEMKLANDRILSGVKAIQSLNIDLLSYEKFKNVTDFKNESKKEIEDLIYYANRMRRGQLQKGEIESIYFLVKKIR